MVASWGGVKAVHSIRRGRGKVRRQRSTRVGVTMTSSGRSCDVMGIGPGTICRSCTVVTMVVRASTAPSSRGQRELEIAVAAALAHASAAAVHRDAAGDDQVDVRQIARRDRHAERRGARDRGGPGEAATQPPGIEVQEAARLGQSRHRHVDVLALAKRAEANGPLRRVGIALEPSVRRATPAARPGDRPPRRRRRSSEFAPSAASGNRPTPRACRSRQTLWRIASFVSRRCLLSTAIHIGRSNSDAVV